MSALLGSFLAHSVAAQPAAAEGDSYPAVGLAWSGPGPELACLGEEGLARAVNEYLGRDAFASGSLEYVLGVSVERLPDRLWRAVLELRDTSGRVLGARELRSATDLCTDLNEPLVLAVALMVDSEPAPPPEPAPAPSPPEPEPELTEEAAPPPRAHAEPLAIFVDASLAIESGLLPAVRPGLMLGAELRALSWLSARLSGIAFLPASVDVPGDASARFAFVAGVLELCPGFGDNTSFRLSLCAGAVYGAVNAQGTGLTGSNDSWHRSLGAAFGVRAAVPLGGRWFGVAGLTGVIPYRPDRFVYDAGGTSHELFQMAPLSLLASAGASFIF